MKTTNEYKNLLEELKNNTASHVSLRSKLPTRKLSAFCTALANRPVLSRLN